MRRVLLAIGAIALVAADLPDHEYADGERVVLWTNKIGPYHNPMETYHYDDMPFCRPADTEPTHKAYGIGEILEGNELVDSGLEFKYAQDTAKAAYCSQTLSEKDVKFFKAAISNHYWYQLYLDDLPMWGMVGQILGTAEELAALEKQAASGKGDISAASSQVYMYTHKKFSIASNGHHVIEVNLTSAEPVEVVAGQTVSFSYEVHWVQSSKQFGERFNRYLDHSFFEHQIHWFSIFNSFMMVVFLCGLVALILLRVLRNDYAKYMREDDELSLTTIERSMPDDSGWKQVHGDVFRPPAHLELFAIVYGTGCQLVVLVFAVVLQAMLRELYIERGGTTKTFVIFHAFTSIVSGAASGSYYRSQTALRPKAGAAGGGGGGGADRWKLVMLSTALFFPAVVAGTLFVMNFIGAYYDTSNAIPIKMMATIILLWMFVSFPLVLGGTLLGRSFCGATAAPCRIHGWPRPIPPKKWYYSPIVMIALTGILPFGSIFIEMYFIFTSFWNYKFYYVYGFMLLVLFILSVVSVCITIVTTYFLLNAEDYRWQWVSFLSSGSTAFYVFLYSIYYFFAKTNMSGLMQTTYYFGYMGLFCFAMWIVCGTIGRIGASVFVRTIFRNVKFD